MAEPVLSYAQRFKDARPEVRLAALGDAMKPGGTMPTAAEVAPLLDDADPNVRHLATVVLGQIGAPAVAALTRALDEKQPPPVRLQAASGLVRVGPPAAPAAEALGKCLGDDNEGLRINAAMALSRMGPPGLPVLRRGLTSEKSAVSSARGIGWLGRAGEPATEDLRKLAASGTGPARIAAVAALVTVKGDPAAGVPQLIGFLQGKDPALRAEAAERIGELQEQGRDAIPALRAALDDAAPLVRAAVALALARVKSVEPETGTALTKKLSDPDPGVQSNAALALERFGPSAKDSLPALKTLAQGKDKHAAIVAGAAIRSIEGAPPAAGSGASKSASPPASSSPTKVTLRTAAEVLARYSPSESTRALAAPAMTPRQLLDALISKQKLADAVHFLANALPKPEAVWWGIVCARASGPPAAMPAKAVTALATAEKWLQDPTDENRRASFPAAQEAGLETPAGATAMGAFLSGGSLAPPSAMTIPPPEHATASMIAGAILQAASSGDTGNPSERLKGFLAKGHEVAGGTNRWPLKR